MDENSKMFADWLRSYMEEDDSEPDIECLQSGLSSERRLEILTQPHHGRSILHKSIQLNHLSVIQLLLNTLPPKEIVDLSTMCSPYTAVYYTVLYNRYEILRDILSCVKAAGKSVLSLLLTQSYDGDSLAHIAAERDHWHLLDCMLESIESTDDISQLISAHGSLKETVLYRAVKSGSQGSVKTIVSHLSSDQLYQIMKIKKIHCDQALMSVSIYQNAKEAILLTPLHTAVSNASTDTVRWLMDPLTARQKIDLLGIADRFDRSPMHLAHLHNTETADLLRSIRTTALIEITKTATSEEDISVIEIAALTPQEFKDLSHCSRKHYIIPRNNGEIQQHAFIFYSSQDRAGAKEEADVLAGTFTNVGFSVCRQEWHNVLQFDSIIIESLGSIADKCSVVVICIMAHGKAGMITGENGSMLPIDNILFQCTEQLPGHIPLIMVIQACQSFHTQCSLSECIQPEIDASKANPPENEHIVLVRPHTLLVHATVMGGAAVRGALAQALKEEFSEVSGNADVLSITTAAFGRLPDQQTAIQLSTLKKRLLFTNLADAH